MTGQKCATCDYWEFGQRSYCSWGFHPGALTISSAYKAGGECHAMGGNDGKDCPTWTPRLPQANDADRDTDNVGSSVDMVGKYRADYSPLTPEEIAKDDPDMMELEANSRPVGGTR